MLIEDLEGSQSAVKTCIPNFADSGLLPAVTAYVHFVRIIISRVGVQTSWNTAFSGVQIIRVTTVLQLFFTRILSLCISHSLLVLLSLYLPRCQIIICYVQPYQLEQCDSRIHIIKAITSTTV